MLFDVAVIGLGAIGSATVWQLAGRGVKTLGLDRFSPPHAIGSSHGDTRITREAIGEGEQYVPLVRRSHALWRALEAETGESLFNACGALIIGAAGGSLAVHGKPGFVRYTADTAAKHGIPHLLLSPDEACRRFPALRLAGDELVYFEPGGGMVYPERIIAAQLAAAERSGASLRLNERVLAIRPDAHGVRIETDCGHYLAAQAVLSAGAWSPQFAAAALQPVQVRRQVLHWFAPDKPDWYRASEMPVFILSHGASSEDSFYGFPLVPGREDAGVKVARENYSTVVADPDAVDRNVQPAEAEAMHLTHLDGRLAGLSRTPLRSAVCLYSCAPDGDFLIGRDPACERLLIVSACSGHGFKHSAGLADALAADLASSAPLAMPHFALDRPGLLPAL